MNILAKIVFLMAVIESATLAASEFLHHRWGLTAVCSCAMLAAYYQLARTGARR